jgi:hypothetical protein
MKLSVTIHCDNAAFEDDPSYELARLLDDIANKLRANGADRYCHYQTLLDYNGNDSGRWRVA